MGSPKSIPRNYPDEGFLRKFHRNPEFPGISRPIPILDFVVPIFIVLGGNEVDMLAPFFGESFPPFPQHVEGSEDTKVLAILVGFLPYEKNRREISEMLSAGPGRPKMLGRHHCRRKLLQEVLDSKTRKCMKNPDVPEKV